MAALLKAAPFNRPWRAIRAATARGNDLAARTQPEFTSCKAQYIGERAKAVNDATLRRRRFISSNNISDLPCGVEFALGFRRGYCPRHWKEKAPCAAKSPNP
jgi:hypothetical protein